MNDPYALLFLILRMEIIVPILIFDMPWAIIPAFGFGIVNQVSEHRFISESNTKTQFQILLRSALINAAIFTVFLFLTGSYILKEDNKVFVDWPKIYATCLLSILIPTCLIVARITIFVVCNILKKTVDKGAAEKVV